ERGVALRSRRNPSLQVEGCYAQTKISFALGHGTRHGSATDARVCADGLRLVGAGYLEDRPHPRAVWTMGTARSRLGIHSCRPKALAAWCVLDVIPCTARSAAARASERMAFEHVSSAASTLHDARTPAAC